MAKKMGISLHPILAAVLELVVGLLYYTLLMRQTNGWLVVIVVMMRVVWWGLLTEFTFYPQFRSRLNHWLTLIFFNVSNAGMLFLLTQPMARYSMVAASVALSAGSFFLIPPRSDVVLAVAKPERRVRWLMALATVAGLWATIFGLATFQTVTGLYRLMAATFGIGITLLLSSWWWYEYDHTELKRRLLGVVVLAILLAEIVYVLFLLPFGYITNAFLVTWSWYTVWMLIRFYYSKEGIRWSRQRYTLGFNLLVLILILVFVVRWH